MEYRQLGRTGLMVSPLCLGAMTFGEADKTSFMHGACADESTSHKILSTALDSGINFIDTADIYGQDGLSERVLGSWLTATKRRDEVVLATKFRFGSEGPNQSGASRYRIMQCIENSLRRLQTDRVDLYQIHMQDHVAPEDETLRALDDLIHQGKVMYIGCSNYTAYRLMESLWTAEKLDLHRYVALQAQYSLVERGLEREHVPLCERHGIGLLSWSPLAGGFLTGKYSRDSDPAKGSRFDLQADWYQGLYTDKNWNTLDTVRAVARDLGATPAQIALAWVLRKPALTSVIFGARTVEQLEENLAATSLTLDDETMARLQEVSKITPGYPYDFIQRFAGRW